MDRSLFVRFGGTFVLIALCFSFTPAQSGRGRRPASPQPTPRLDQPVSNPLNVPEGGRLVRQDVDGITTRYLLRNGLTIIIRERHSIPLTAATIYVKAGTFNETHDQAGLAPLTARMILKGTAARSASEFEKEMRRRGALFQTDFNSDHTIFNIVAPSESIVELLKLQSDLLQNPAFDVRELKKAAQETIRAARRFQDDAAASSFERLYATTFTTHPLKNKRFGAEMSINAFTREQVLAFHQTYYQPQHTIISIVGDVISAQIIAQIQQSFGQWAKSQTTPATLPEEPVQDKLRYSNARSDSSQSYVTIGYRIPASATTVEALKEQAAIEMLAAALAIGQGSRLTQVLREGSRLASEAREKGELAGLVTDISAAIEWWPSAALFVVQLRVDPARIDRAEAEFFREIERFKREVLSDGELQRARYILEKHHFDALSRVEDEARKLARYQALFNDFRILDSYIARLSAVTAKDMQQAAAKYLTLTNVSVHENEPHNTQARTFTPEAFAQTITIFAPTIAQPINPADVKPAATLRTFRQGGERSRASESHNVIIAEAPLPIKDFSVLRGPRAFVREDHSQPKLSVGIYFQGGRFIETQTTSGMTELMLRTMLKGTAARKSDLIALEIESYGGEIQIVNEPDFFGFTLDVLSRNAEVATRLLVDIIESPYFDKAEVMRERERLIADHLAARDKAREHAAELLSASLYPNHPYGLPRYGVPAIIKAATPETLEAWHGRTIKRQLPLIVIVGDTDGSALISRIFSESFKRSDLDKSVKTNLPDLTSSPQELKELRKYQQTVQALGFRTLANQSNDIYALDLLARFVAMRLAIELRDRQNVADEVIVVNDVRLASGIFSIVISSDPELEAKAREAVRAVLSQIANAPSMGNDIDDSRNTTIGTYAISLQTHSVRSVEYARAIILGRKASDIEIQPNLIRAIKQADLRRVTEVAIKLNQAGFGAVRGEATSAQQQSKRAN